MTTQPSDGGSRPGDVVCDREFRLPAAGHLRLVGHFPSTVDPGHTTVSGTVEVTSDRPASGVAAPVVDAFLVRAGKVVTTPLPQDARGVRFDLAADETRSVPAVGALVSCGQGGGPVPPGDYELYARFVLTPDDGEPGVAFGGPWPLRVAPP